MATDAALKAVQALLKPKNKGKNLFDIAFRHPDFGVNRIYTRNILKKYSKDPKNIDSFWYVTKVEEGVRSPVANKGKAWGIFVFKGIYFHKGEVRRIPGTHKRDWSEITNTAKLPVWPKEPSPLAYKGELKVNVSSEQKIAQ